MRGAVTRPLRWIVDGISHYPVLFWGAVSATIAFRWRSMDTPGELMVTAWITFLQTVSSKSRKGAEEEKAAERDKTLAEVASLAGQPGPPPIIAAQPKPVVDTPGV